MEQFIDGILWCFLVGAGLICLLIIIGVIMLIFSDDIDEAVN